MEKKKVFIFVFFALSAIVVSFVILTQFIFTVSISPTYAECYNWGAVYPSLESMAEAYNSDSLESCDHVISFNGSLPSSNPDDYTSIICNFEVKNRSFLEKYEINGTLLKANKYKENILFATDANSPIPVHADRNGKADARILLDIYVGNLSEKQLEELIKGLEVSVKAYGKYFGTKTKDISYSTCDISFGKPMFSNEEYMEE